MRGLVADAVDQIVETDAIVERRGLRATGNRDAASRGRGTHLATLSSVDTHYQGASLLAPRDLRTPAQLLHPRPYRRAL
ncbi:hypothetical protein [Frankia sp. Cr2]|uniref:hypothetical protein n=1 Tax=Frankia sp. Cr2 TaxID=3073932 RepID=UPI002AD21854|nr:hypothetical protein [Frankia sp. Cr2]